MPQHEDDLEEFRKKFWRLLKREANQRTGPQVIEALKRASKATWDIGADDAWKEMSKEAQARIADAYDLIWMTALALELRKMKK
jgi:hypothetical protein